MAAVIAPSGSTDPFWKLIQLDYDHMESDIEMATAPRVLNGSNINSAPTVATYECSDDCDSPRESCALAELSLSEQLDQTTSPYITSSPVNIMDSANTCAASPPTTSQVETEDMKEEDIESHVSSTPLATKSYSLGSETADQNTSQDQDKTSARLRIRWAKTLPTKASQVYLKAPFQGSAIRMPLNKQTGVYESEEYQIPVGDHHCMLHVDMKDHKVEPLEIRYYTFEADVFLTEEEETRAAHLEERKSSKPPIPRPAAAADDITGARRKIPSSPSTLRKELVEKPSKPLESRTRSLEHILPSTSPKVKFADDQKTEDRKKLTLPLPPSDEMEDDMDVQSLDSSGGIKRSRMLEQLVQRQLGFGGSEQKEHDVGSVLSEQERKEKCEYIGDYREIRRCDDRREERWSRSQTPTRLSSRNAGSEQELNRYLDPARKNTDAGIRTSSVDRRLDNGQSRSRENDYYTKENVDSRRHDGAPESRYADRTGSADILDSRRNEDRYKYSRDDTQSKSDRNGKDFRHSSLPSLNRDRNYRDSTKDVYSRDDDYKKERDYGDRDGGKDYQGSVDYHTRDGDYAKRDYSSDRERQYSEEKGGSRDVRGSRDYASDGEYRSDPHRSSEQAVKEPVIRSSLTTNRTVPLSRSGAGKMTSPLTTSTGQEGTYKERIAELESTVASVRRVLSQRDSEMEDIRAANRSLHNELRQARTSPAPSGSQEADKRINELIREKENMATELWKLRQEKSSSHPPAEQHEGEHTNGLDYDPQNKRALTRKIEELESQLGDLQEANEATVANLQRVEKDLEIAQQPSASTTSMRHLEEDNRRLRSQLDRISSLGSDQEYLQREVDQLRADLRTLRDKNHTLVQDNIKLTEHLRDIEVGPAHRADDKYARKEEAFDRDVFRVRGQKFNADPTNKMNGFTNGHDVLDSRPGYPVRRRERDNSPEGSTVSDSTAVLMSAAPSGIKHASSSHTATTEPEAYPRHRGGADPTHYSREEEEERYKNRTRKDDDELPLHRLTPAVSDVHLHSLPLSSSSSSSNRRYQQATDKASYHSNLGSESSTTIRASSIQSHSIRHNALNTSLNNKPLPSFSSITKAGEPRAPSNSSLVADEFLSEEEDEDEEQRMRRRGRGRKDSLNSDCTDFILGEADQMLRGGGEDTTKAVASGDHRNFTPPGSPRSRSPGLGLRTCSPKPQVTQHNKHINGPPERDDTFMIGGRRPFSPRNPSELQLGDIVKFSRQGGKISRGVVKYIGHLPNKNDTYCGVELEHENGKHDGVYDEQRYFTCKANKGVFVAFTKIVMAWGK